MTAAADTMPPLMSNAAEAVAQTVESTSSHSSNVGNPNSKPQVEAATSPRPKKHSLVAAQDGDDAAWGSNFWVTLVDPQSQASFFACPATGQVSWDPPVGSFVLPPSEEGEWWELSDDSRGGIPYYYQTKTGETVWERPGGFVIPLGIIQNTALGRRLSQTTRFAKSFGAGIDLVKTDAHEKLASRRSRQPTIDMNQPSNPQARQSNTGRSASANPKSPVQRSYSSNPLQAHASQSQIPSQRLTPIPGSDVSAPPSPSQKSVTLLSATNTNDLTHTQYLGDSERSNGALLNGSFKDSDFTSRARAKSSSYISHRAQQPQSLNAALEKISIAHSDSGHGSSPKSPTSISSKTTGTKSRDDHDWPVLANDLTSSNKTQATRKTPISPRRSIPLAPSPGRRSISGPTIAGRGISAPIPNHAATLQLSPVKNRVHGKPIPVQPRMHSQKPTPSLKSGKYPILPADLAIDIQQFSESEFAQQYFSTHRTGFIFKRKVPVIQMMAWQKAPLNSPLLTLNRSLAKDAVKLFKVIQHLMGDRDREKASRMQSENHLSTSAPNGPMANSGITFGMLEEERWLLGEGLSHGELRDEIYCQVMKQLTGNPNTESVFKGWQLLCVLLITFPPSKNFESYLSSFFQQHTTYHEGRIDVMAKYCLRRLSYISKKGPRGKPPSLAEIETASDAAFHPSTFGESLDAIIRLQERKYPEQKVPIILPFLTDGILALGGLKSEGIFRVPGDSDSVSDLKLRIDRGYYTTDGVNDPHVLASLMKLWLRELCDPLVPEEMYNECITSSRDAGACVRIIERLPTINRRVVLFVISFLQLFLEEKVQSITKMTPANLALVMAPNLLRCNSDSMSVVFTNAQYEQIFVYHLLLHLQCNDVDFDYFPTHGLGATSSTARPRSAKSRLRP